MGILFNSTILLNIVIYAILFNIIYSMLYKVNSFWLNVIIYVVAMEIKLYITYSGEFMSCYTLSISLLVYFILGIIIDDVVFNWSIASVTASLSAPSGKPFSISSSALSAC